MSDEFLSLPGAVESLGDDGVGLGVPSHFGSPLIEQRALDTGDAVVSLSHHGVVTVSGQDRLSWLNSMTSQHLLDIEPGVGVETLLLDPQGHIEQVIRLVDDGDRSWLLVDEGRSVDLAEYLQRMRFAMRVEVHDVSEEYATLLTFDGGGALPALRSSGLVMCEWRDPWGAVQPGGAQYSHAGVSGAEAQHASAGWAAVQLVVQRSSLVTVAAMVSDGVFSAAGTAAIDALEVQAWRPSYRGDVDDRALPHEFDWLRTAVHLNKGCYRGQETVAKVHNLGHPPRRFTLLHLDGSGGELPKPGALVFVAGTSHDEHAKPVGRVTRVALHYEWGGIALALLKRSTPEDAPLEVLLGDASDVAHRSSSVIAATQEVIVPSDAGKTRDVAKLRRL